MSSLIAAGWREDPQQLTPGTLRRVGDLVAAVPAGRIPLTVGLAAVSAGAASSIRIRRGGTDVGGVFGAAQYPAALGISQVEVRGNRVWGVPCRGVGAKQALIQSGWSVAVSAGGSWSWSNPFTDGPHLVRIWGNSGYGNGGYSIPKDYETWRRVLAPDGSVQVEYYTKKVPGSELWEYVGRSPEPYGGGANDIWRVFPGATLSAYSPQWGFYGGISFLDVDTSLDWKPAVAALEWMDVGQPWQGYIWEAARAGGRVTRQAWGDGTRTLHYVAGAGTTRAVAVRESGAVATVADFAGADWLAEDWLVVGGQRFPVDVTDWLLDGPAWSVPFAVSSLVPVVGDGGPVWDGVVPKPPASGDFVFMSRDGIPQWVQTRTFACPAD